MKFNIIQSLFLAKIIPRFLELRLDILKLLKYNELISKNHGVEQKWTSKRGDKMSTTAERVSQIIKAKGYKQCVIAEKAGFSPKDFSNLLCGRKTFKTEYVNPICNALGVTPNDIFGLNS